MGGERADDGGAGGASVLRSEGSGSTIAGPRHSGRDALRRLAGLLGRISSSMTTTLVLGGGFGGIAAARLLRRALPADHEVRLVTNTPDFQIGATKTWVMLGEAEPARVSRPVAALAAHGIRVELAEVLRIDARARTVTTDAGERAADYLVLALGATLDRSGVPGLDAAETFYTRDGAVRLRETLRGFEGGRVVLLIPRLPFQCPPGPYEGAMLLHAHLERRGIRAGTALDVHTVEKAPMGTAGPEIGKVVVARLAERGIGFHPRRETREVDGARRVVVMADGSEVPYDLLIAIPPHLPPRAVRESGLGGPSGWVPVDPRTLEIANSPSPGRVFAIGDVAGVPLPGRFAPDLPLSLPKAGIFAEREAAVVAARIAAHASGGAPTDVFDGKGFCFIEMGAGLAMRGDGSFFELPHPVMTPQEPGPALLAEKKAWVERWMATYL